MIRLTLLEVCGKTLQIISAPESAMLQTPTDLKQADQFVACSKAALTIPGQNANGDMTYTSMYGGLCMNSIQIRHLPGADGPVYAYRMLAFSISNDKTMITITFGTNASGVIVVPTAAEVAALCAVYASGSSVVAVAGGDGSGLVGAQDYTHLAGGLSDGDQLKIAGGLPVCLYVALKETI